MVASALGRGRPACRPWIRALPSENGTPPTPRPARPAPAPRRRSAGAAAHGRAFGGDAAGARAGREGGAQHGAGAGHGESGTGKELVARHPRDQRARRAALHRGELRRDSRAPARRPSSSATARARSPAPTRTARLSSRPPRRHAVPRRDRRPAAVDAEQAAARAIQDAPVRPVGAVSEQPVNVRIVSATHKDLAAEVQAGRFRQDLFYRLNVIQIRVPPLRERLDDLPACASACSSASPATPACRRRRASPRRWSIRSPLRLPRQRARAGNLLHRAVALSGGETIASPTSACTAADWARPSSPTTRCRICARSRRRPPARCRRRSRALVPRRSRCPATSPPTSTTGARHPRARARAPSLQPHRGRREPGLSLRQMRYRMARLGVNVGSDGIGADAIDPREQARRVKPALACRLVVGGAACPSPNFERPGGRVVSLWCCIRSACRRASTAATRSSSCSPTGSTGRASLLRDDPRAAGVGALRRATRAAKLCSSSCDRRAWHAGRSAWRGARTATTTRWASSSKAWRRTLRTAQYDTLVAGAGPGWRAAIRSRRSPATSTSRRGASTIPVPGFDWPVVAHAAAAIGLAALPGFPDSATRRNRASATELPRPARGPMAARIRRLGDARIRNGTRLRGSA